MFWAADPTSFELGYVSAFAEAVLGLPLAAWTRPSFWQDHLFVEDRQRVLALFAEAVFTGEPQELEYRLYAVDGSLHWVRDKVCLLTHEGKPTLCGMMVDVTSFKTAVGFHVGLPGHTSVFLEIIKLLSENVDIQTSLQAVAETLLPVFNVTDVYIWEWDSAWDRPLQLAFASEASAPTYDVDNPPIYELSNLLDELGWQQPPRPIVFDSQMGQLPVWQEKYLQAHRAKTILHVPIVANNKVIGCIEMVDRHASLNISASDIELGQNIGQQVGVAITRTHLFQAEASRRREAEILLDVAEFVSSSLDRDEILRRVMEILRVYITDVHHCAISIFREDDGFLETIFSWWADAAYALVPVGTKLRLRDTFTANLALTGGEPVIISDLANHPFANEFTKAKYKEGLRSILCVPLKIQDRPLGSLQIHHWHNVRHFTAEEIAVVQGVANQTAIAIDNARLFANERRQLRLSRTLQKVGSLLTASVPLSVVYEQIFELLSQVIVFDSASLFLYEKSEKQFSMVASVGFDSAILQRVNVSVPMESIHRRIENTSGWVVVDDVTKHSDWVERQEIDFIRGWIGALLLVKGETIGLLCIDSKTSSRYSQEDGRTVAAFANQAAVAIENARLAVETARQAKELAILNLVSKETAVSLDIDRFLEKITNRVWQELYTELFGFILWNPESDEIKPHASYRGISVDLAQVIVPLHKSISGHVLQTGKPYYTPNVPEDPYCYSVETNMRSEIAVPLTVEGAVVGVIDVSSSRLDHFSEQDRNFLITLAGSVSAVLERAKLYERQRMQAQMLTELVAQRTAELKLERDRLFAILESAGEGIILTDTDAKIMYANPAMERQSGYSRKELMNNNPRVLGSQLVPKVVFDRMWDTLANQHSWAGELINRHKDGHVYDVAVKVTPISDAQGKVTGFVSVQSDITRIKDLERLKTEFIANVSHQLRTPLTNIKTYVSLLKKGRPENYPRYFSVLHYEIDRLAKLIQDLLDISRLDAEAAPNPNASADFCDMWDMFWTPHVERAERENKSLRLTFPDAVRLAAPQIQMEAFQIEKLLSRLIENAFLYSPEGSTLEAIVDMPASQPGFLQLKICDDGPGVPEGERPFVFDRFFRGKAAVEAGLPGNGLGLAIVRELLVQYDGQISLESIEGEGSQFTVLLPWLVPARLAEARRCQ
ncbi:MAG: GAF domain-containing protein [Anaerolineales bacterium]|nr:GAF domain-containing protein [Anaerolineales bacterium]